MCWPVSDFSRLPARCSTLCLGEKIRKVWALSGTRITSLNLLTLSTALWFVYPLVRFRLYCPLVS